MNNHRFHLKTAMMLLLVLALAISIKGAAVSHSPAQVTPGTFTTGNYIFPDNLSVSGSVGIGMTPSYPLDVNGNARMNTIRIKNSTNERFLISYPSNRLYMAPYDDGAWQWGREFGYDDTTNKWYFDDGFTSSGAITATTLDTGQGANELYDMNQNVLTSSRPDFAGVDLTSNLQVTSSATTGQPTFATFTTSNSESLMIRYAEASTGIVPANNWQFRMGGTAARNIIFTSYDNTPVLNLDTSGSISVGTTTINERITIAGGGIAIDEDNNDNWVGIGEYNQGLALSESADASSSPRLVVDNAGHVSIYSTLSVGGSFTGYSVVVNGDVNTKPGYGYRSSGTCVAGDCTSDIRLKDNITYINNSLEKITNLRPVTFVYKNESYGPTNKTSYGLIAQEVEEIYPDWVTENDGHKGIMYGQNIQMELLESIKELREEKNSEIKELKITINRTDSKNIELEKDNSMLKNALCSMNQTFEFC